MTKTQQKLAEQATVFVNSGGKALTAIVQILLLSLAVLFEAVSLLFSHLDEVITTTELGVAERPKERSETLTLAPLSEQRDIAPRQGGFATEPATLMTGTTGGLTRRK